MILFQLGAEIIEQNVKIQNILGNTHDALTFKVNLKNEQVKRSYSEVSRN